MTEKETTGVINVIGTFCMKIIGFLQKIREGIQQATKKHDRLDIVYKNVEQIKIKLKR